VSVASTAVRDTRSADGPEVSNGGPAQHGARLFIALWPSPALAAALVARREAVGHDPAAQPEAAARLHLTLHFLGAVPQTLRPALRAALCQPFRPFELQLDRCERWSNGMLAMCPAGVPPSLAALHAALGMTLAGLGLPTDDRPFRPHVTLARRWPGPEPAPGAGATPLRWQVGRYVLAESVPGRTPVYRILQCCSAGQAPRRQPTR
jgi:RNA 2',3'-cyclic 3'-phosphodiesterase